MATTLPKHIAIIMDGNGRWAKRRLLPRIAGHQQGIESVRAVVSACVEKKIEILTLFAFSSENWLRPEGEINFLLSLCLKFFKNDIEELKQNNIRVKIMGDWTPFSSELQKTMHEAETLTESNTGLRLNIALNYGGRWDIIQAVQSLSEQVARGEIQSSEITEKKFQTTLSLGRLGETLEPDFLIRTSGELRISNFLLWDIAYTELYFTDTFWPDFRKNEFDIALNEFANRQRRFGKTEEHLGSLDTVEYSAHA
jgi:undecaprenyl diphosphate synthase